MSDEQKALITQLIEQVKTQVGALRDLVGGLTRSERNRRDAEKRILDILKRAEAMLTALTAGTLTAEVLAESCEQPVLDRARAMRRQMDRGEPVDLPPPPVELIPRGPESMAEREDVTAVMALTHTDGKPVHAKDLKALLTKAIAVGLLAFITWATSYILK
jgi:hypothetical protein